jgi:flagellar protein FlgJ
MDINPNLSSATTTQLQARYSMAQAQRVLDQAQGDAQKAGEAYGSSKTPEEKAQAYKSLVKASQDFESIFLNYMLKSMRATVPKSSLFGEDTQADDIFNSMKDEELAKRMSQAGGIGLAKIMVKQLEKHI